MTIVAPTIVIPDEPGVETVRQLAARYSNWGRWGAEDQLGTLNHIRPSDVVAAASLVRSGRTFSLAIPVDENGPADRRLRPVQPDPPDDPRRQRGGHRHDGP